MTSPPRRREVNRQLSVQANEAAAMLGISRASFDKHVAPDLSFRRVGSTKLYRVVDLEAWLADGRQVIA